MRHRFFVLSGLLAMALSGQAGAGVSTDQFTQCTTNAVTAADRAALARWAFVSAGADPAVSDLVAISDAERQEVFRLAGSVLDRIVLRDCRREAVIALRSDGRASLAGGFFALGELGGRGMLSSTASQAVASSLFNYMNRAGVEALAREAGMTLPPPSPRAN